MLIQKIGLLILTFIHNINLHVLLKKKLKTIQLILVIFILSHNSYSQELFGQKSTVEITQKWFYDHSEFKEAERKEIKVFDKKGRLIKDIEFGFHHNYNLNLVGNIDTYEYQNNKLISEKTYNGETSFKNNSVLFYWNHLYEDSKIIKTVSNHSNYTYSYDIKERPSECIVIRNWDSTRTKYSLKYNNKNEMVCKTQYYGNNIRNWTQKYTKKGDTLISEHYSFNYPKKNDTTKTIVKEVFKNNGIIFSHTSNFGESKRKYNYSNNGQLTSVYTKIIDETKKELKTELTYSRNGIINQIREYELENNGWILKERIDFKVNGTKSILNKKERKKVNKILIDGNKNWLQQWL